MFLFGLLLQISPAVGPPERVEISPGVASFEVGEVMSFSAKAYDKDETEINDLLPRWHIAESKLATIDQEGSVRALAPGRVIVVAVMGGKPGYAEITIVDTSDSFLDAELPVSEILSGTSVPLQVTLNGSIPQERLRYRSSDSSVATVGRDGRIHGKNPGSATVTVRTGKITTTLEVTVVDNPIVSYRIAQTRYIVRQGDVVRFRIQGMDQNGETVEGLYPRWEASGGGAYLESEAADGVFVAEDITDYTITAQIGENIRQKIVLPVEPRVQKQTLSTIGRGVVANHHSADMWAFEGVDGRDYAYLGTYMHDWMKVFDITNPSRPILVDSLQVDARRINDVKIHSNNRLAVITREGASNRRNGIVILDLSVPAHPKILSEYTATVTGGVHNVWIEQDLVYACHNGTNALHIIDISDPIRPREVGRWELNKTEKTLHDVIIQDGYAYVSYWDDGIVILDVGAGRYGGTQTNPVMVSRLSYPEGNTHVAWRHGRYLFVGDEIWPEDYDVSKPLDAKGHIHILDLSEIDHPVEVARYEVPDAGAHNIWIDEDRLYVGYYQGGLRVVDISGELRGELYNQGREIAHLLTTDDQSMVPGWPMTWGAQVFKGYIYSSDLNSGLWVTRLEAVNP